MAKTTTAIDADATVATTTAQAAPQDPPRLGDLVTVQVPEGLALINNETGLQFEPGVPTLQTVTVTTLRRLADGDLVRV